MRVAILTPEKQCSVLLSDIRTCFMHTLLENSKRNEQERLLMFGWSEEVYPEAKDALEGYLLARIKDGWVTSFLFGPTPQADEDEDEDDGDKDEDEEEDVLTRAQAILKQMNEERFHNTFGNPFGEGLDIACTALERFIALEQGYISPRQHIELPNAPALLFPLVHADSGHIIWIEQYPTHYGYQTTIHQTKPTLETLDSSSDTGMAGIHLDYYQKGEREILQVQLHDEEHGPYNDPHWRIPEDYSTRTRDASILLVEDVEQWVCHDYPLDAKIETLLKTLLPKGRTIYSVATCDAIWGSCAHFYTVRGENLQCLDQLIVTALGEPYTLHREKEELMGVRMTGAFQTVRGEVVEKLSRVLYGKREQLLHCNLNWFSSENERSTHA